MYIFLLIILSFSFVGIIFVLALKIFEVKTGRVGLLGKLSIAADPMFRRDVEKVKFFLSKCNKTNIRAAFITGTHNLFHAFGTIGLVVSKHHKRLISRINGRRIIKGKGAVSFFLKDVSESKGNDKQEKT